MVNDKQDHWDQFIDVAMFSMRSEHQSSTKYTPFEVMYGRKPIDINEKEPTDAELSVTQIVLNVSSTYMLLFSFF